MKLKKLYLQEGIYERTIIFGDNTLIYSIDNTQGKTTLIRLILHAL